MSEEIERRMEDSFHAADLRQIVREELIMHRIAAANGALDVCDTPLDQSNKICDGYFVLPSRADKSGRDTYDG